MLCISIRGPTIAQAERQIIKASTLADIIELRLDLFSTEDIVKTAITLQSTSALPMIGTLRSIRQGGRYTGTVVEHCQIIERLAASHMAYIDCEDSLPSEYVRNLGMSYPKVKIIFSHHDFSETPNNLDTVYETMLQTPAFAYKLAYMAKNSSEMLRLLVWAKKHRNVIAISMGPYGQASRIVGPIIKNPITYASLSDEPVAPGQLSGEELTTKYHFRSLNSFTSIYGLIGDPVSRSISDVTHNALCVNESIDAVYVKMHVLVKELPEFLHLSRSLPFAGLSVTMPLKEAVVPHLDFIDPTARDIGAVNTLLFKEGEIFGHNTDGIGALSAIEQTLPVQEKRILIIGTGGAAKAIAYEAQRRGALVTIVGRDELKTQKTAAALGCCGMNLDQIGQCVKAGYDILINCTPSAMPIAKEHIIQNSLVMDTTTVPALTPLLQTAIAKNCRVVYGYQMFAAQAKYQWELWEKTVSSFAKDSSPQDFSEDGLSDGKNSCRKSP